MALFFTVEMKMMASMVGRYDFVVAPGGGGGVGSFVSRLLWRTLCLCDVNNKNKPHHAAAAAAALKA